MKKMILSLLPLLLLISSISYSQMIQKTTVDPAMLSKGCSVVEITCQCTNPTRNFVIPGQKVGKVNPGEPGQCRSYTYIDEFLTNFPMVFCLQGGGGERDPRQQQTSCEAQWKCKQPCVNPI